MANAGGEENNGHGPDEKQETEGLKEKTVTPEYPSRSDGEDDIECGKEKKNDGSAATIPTAAEVFCNFNGSLGFVVGSSGFILAVHFDDGNWLPYYRYGSLSWIWGCLWYLFPIFAKLLPGRGGWGATDIEAFLCNTLWFVGCVFGGFFDQPTIEKFIPAINHLFLYGCLLLLLEPSWTLLQYLFVKIKKKEEDNDEVDDDRVDDEQRRRERLDRTLELLAATFYILAGIFGGFPPEPWMALPGVYCWEVGSLCSFSRSFLMLSERRRGLAAMQS